MAWPEVKSSSFSSAAEAARERAKRKKRNERNSNAALAAIDAPVRSNRFMEMSPRTAEHLSSLERVLEMLRSNEFRAWYEVTTGEPVGPWLAWVAIPSSEYLNRYSGDGAPVENQIEWIESQVQFVIDRNPWTNPDRAALWAEEVAECTDPQRRRAILLKLATPRWADRQKIQAIYLERARIEKETGIPHDVDHIVPIVNQRVCGLHWEGNLRVIPASDNRKKSNSFYADDAGLDRISADRKIRSNLTL